jgi:hypothetical protein
MTPKQKSIFELISKYASSRGCEYLEMDVDPWNYTPYNGRSVGCGTEEYEKKEKMPFDISELITEYTNENLSDVDDENLSGLNFRLYPKTRTVTISGTYQEIVDGGSSESEKNKEEDENLKEIMEFLESEGIYPFAEVDFSGGGDSGYIDDMLHVYAGEKEERTVDSVPGLSDYLYEMLSEYGGWEINEGSFGNFTIDTRAGTITLKFTWNEYAYEDVVFHQEEF